MSRIPNDPTLEQALALGGTRVATYAHPHCRCQKPKPLPPRVPAELVAWKAEHGNPREHCYAKKDCPMHTGTAGGV